MRRRDERGWRDRRRGFKSPAVVAGLDDVAVVDQPVEQRGGHLGVAEHARPFAEGKIGGDDDRGALVDARNRRIGSPTR